MPTFNQDGTTTIQDKVTDGNLVYYILGFERNRGWFQQKDKIHLFSFLIKNGFVKNWRKIYGKTAKELVDSGYLDYQGTILDKKYKSGGEKIIVPSNC